MAASRAAHLPHILRASRQMTAAARHNAACRRVFCALSVWPHSCCLLTAQRQIYIYTTKIDGVVCPPNISETVAGRLMKLAHRPCIASTMIKLISKPILLILVKTIQRIVADPKRKLSPPFDSPDSVPSLGHPAPGPCKMLSLFTVLCDYSVSRGDRDRSPGFG